MGKLSRVYTGLYTQSRKNHMSIPTARNQTRMPDLTQLAATYFWTAYASINGNYMAIMTVCLVVLLSFILPDISQKIHRTQELKAMKKVLYLMSKEVSRAEVACLTVAEQLSHLQCSMHDGATETLNNQQDLAVCTSGSMRTTQSAPVQVEKKIGFFRRIFFPNKNTSNKEVTLMSYLYTDSFDALRNKNNDATEVY